MGDLKIDWQAGQSGHPEEHNALALRLNRVKWVDDFGAVGNGTTDDATAITAAFTAAGVGGIVCLTPGKVYAVGSSIVIHRAGVRFNGNGAMIKQLDAENLTDVVEVVGYGGIKVEGVVITDLKIDANYGGQTVANVPRGLHVSHAEGCVIDRVEVKNAWVSLDVAGGCKHVSVTNSICRDYYNDAFETSGTGSLADDEPRFISFVGCHAIDPREGANNAFEIEDGAYGVTVMACHAPDGMIGIRNHGGEHAMTDNINIIGTIFHTCTITNTDPTATDYVKNVRIISCVGTVVVEGTVDGLLMLPDLTA